ncbi:hypothetical protein BDN70DRAFT_962023, partial [Pholiota conissans]
SLIDRLPPEIAGEIYASCIPDNFFDLRWARFDIKFCPPLVISAVCRMWQDLAYSVPRLWNVLPFYASRLNSPSRGPTPVIINKWIDRAGQLPLSIILYVSDLVFDKDFFLEVADVLNQVSNRLRSLIFFGNPSIVSYFSSQTQSLPELRTIHFDSTRPPHDLELKYFLTACCF